MGRLKRMIELRWSALRAALSFSAALVFASACNLPIGQAPLEPGLSPDSTQQESSSGMGTFGGTPLSPHRWIIGTSEMPSQLLMCISSIDALRSPTDPWFANENFRTSNLYTSSPDFPQVLNFPALALPRALPVFASAFVAPGVYDQVNIAIDYSDPELCPGMQGSIQVKNRYGEFNLTENLSLSFDGVIDYRMRDSRGNFAPLSLKFESDSFFMKLAGARNLNEVIRAFEARGRFVSSIR